MLKMTEIAIKTVKNEKNAKHFNFILLYHRSQFVMKCNKTFVYLCKWRLLLGSKLHEMKNVMNNGYKIIYIFFTMRLVIVFWAIKSIIYDCIKKVI